MSQNRLGPIVFENDKLWNWKFPFVTTIPIYKLNDKSRIGENKVIYQLCREKFYIRYMFIKLFNKIGMLMN